ncbi:hypothetical protein ACO1O0_005039 [Amphichorda felina]
MTSSPSGSNIAPPRTDNTVLSDDLHNALASLGADDLDPALSHKVTTTYSGMSPMDRFAAETCQIQEGRTTMESHADDQALSGQATQGSGNGGFNGQ